MPEQTDIRTLVSLETDDKGIDDARRQLKEVVKEQQNLTDAFKRGEKDAAEFNREMAALLSKEKGLEKAIDSVTGEFREQAKAMQEAAEEAAKLAQEQEQLSTAQGRFDKVSGDVSLAGDFASASSQVGGGFEGLGFQGAGKVGEIGTFIGDILEGVPKLKASFAGLPGAINGAGAALGTSGAGFIGILGIAAIAIGAVAIAFKKFSDDAKKQADELNAVVDARRDVGQDIAGGLGKDEATTRIDEINRQREAEAQLLADLKQAYDENISSQNALAEGVLRLTPQEQALADQIKTSEAAIQGYNSEQQALQTALENGTLAANDAAQAERDLAAERTQGVLTEAQQAGELEAQRLRLADATKEQIAAELEGLEIRKASLEAELASLQASGDTSEEVKSRIDQLTESLSFLGEQSSQLEKLRSSAQTDKQVEAEKKLAAAREETAKASDKAGSAETRSASRRSSPSSGKTLGFGFLLGGGSKSDGQAAKAQDEAKKQADEFQDKLRDIQQQAQDDRLKQEINHQRALQDVVRNFGDNRVDALAEQNFLALDKLNTEEARAKRDLAIDNRRANEDINRQARQANERLMQEAQRAQQQRLDMERQALTQSLNNVNSWANALLSITNRLGSARGGGSSSSFNRQPRTP